MISIARNALKLRPIINASRIFLNRNLATAKEEENPNEPLKFLGSDAQKLKASTLRAGSTDPNDIPWFQPFVVVGSVAIFLLYFCVLREENDVDERISRPIFDTVPQLEVSTLTSLYKYNLENQIDNTPVIKRLLELGVDPLKIKW